MTDATNPLLAPWPALPDGTPFPPMSAVRPEHFEPAIEEALVRHRAELDAIAHNPQPPTFANTVAAFDASGAALARVEHMLKNLSASASTDALRAAERVLVPQLAAHESAVLRHAGLFARLDALHQARDTLGLAPADRRLLERLHLEFVRAGARLAPAAQARLAAIVERLAQLYTEFSQNLLADENGWALPLESEDDLAGLPESLRAALGAAATERGIQALGAVTLSRSSAIPFLTFSDHAPLREAVWRAWVARGEGTLVPGVADNRPLAREILALRQELAALHGYATFADYALDDRMAETPAAARGLLERVWQAAVPRMLDDARLLREAGGLADDAAIAPWDWRYLAEKVRRDRFAVDDNVVKPYFSLDAMIGAMFDCASRLFGIAFRELDGAPVYHPDLRVWEVSRPTAQGRAVVGHFIGDNFARPGKRGGAWMWVFRDQSARPGQAAETPVVINNNNFAKPPPGQPCLLSLNDVRTLFHEFGHGLHGLLSNVPWRRLSGTSVRQDFVELPSQLFEHWAREPGVLQQHACHVETGEPIPEALLARVKAAERFNTAHETTQYTAASLIDLALHETPQVDDIDQAEQRERVRLGVPEAAGLMHRPPQFRHLFSGDAYAAGYYVYMWAEVLDADAFRAFKEAGDPFDAATAQRLLQHIYSAGDTAPPREAYRAFRGRDAQPEAMLVKRGLLPEEALAA